MPCDPALELGRIRLAAFDVDGVLTDGRFLLLSSGEDGATFDTRDGLALKLLLSEGIQVALITGRRSRAVRARVENLGIPHLSQGIGDKAGELRKIASRIGVPLDQTLFMGDDLPDLPAMAVAGVAVAVADAVTEVRDRAAFVTTRPGGRGAVREVAEALLRARGRWEAVVHEISETSE